MGARRDVEGAAKRGRGRPPKPITATKSAQSRLGRAMRQLRENEPVSLATFAARTTYSEGHLSRVEHGQTAPSRELVEAYETLLRSDGLLTSLYEMLVDEQRQARIGRRDAPAPDRAEVSTRPPETRPGDPSEFVADLALPDGSVVAASEPLEKRWRLRNAGSVVWRERRLERIGPCSGPAAISSPRDVPIMDTPPGETVDIAVPLVAPSLPGTVIAYWQMIDDDGWPCFPDRYPDAIYALLTVH